ncbi:MAG: DUF4340 domain-containing protein [Caulobacterales bacterium]
MTSQRNEKRRARAVTLAAIAAVMSAIAFVSVSIDARSSRPEQAQGQVLPNLQASLERARRIIVTSPEGAYRIERTDDGWTMRDRGDYPVNAARVKQLTDGLSELVYTRRMTSDAQRHPRLGVGDPREGGRGVLVQIEDGQGALLANVILGVETQGLYVRKPGENQVWAARGELPPLRDAAMWLSLRPLNLEASQFARVEIVPQEGRPYILERESRETNDFAIVAPARLAPSTPAVVTAAAEKLATLTPIDVQPAPAIQGTPQARVRIHAYNGVMIDGELIPSDGKIWLKITAQPENPEAEQASLAINNASAGWAYALSENEAAALAPPLSSLLPAPPAPPTPQETSAPPPATP